MTIVHPRIQYKCDINNICKKVIAVEDEENEIQELIDCPKLNHLTPILVHGACVPCSSHTQCSGTLCQMDGSCGASGCIMNTFDNRNKCTDQPSNSQQCSSINALLPIFLNNSCNACQNSNECSDLKCQNDGSCYGIACLDGFEEISGKCQVKQVIPEEPVAPVTCDSNEKPILVDNKCYPCQSHSECQQLALSKDYCNNDGSCIAKCQDQQIDDSTICHNPKSDFDCRQLDITKPILGPNGCKPCRLSEECLFSGEHKCDEGKCVTSCGVNQIDSYKCIDIVEDSHCALINAYKPIFDGSQCVACSSHSQCENQKCQRSGQCALAICDSGFDNGSECVENPVNSSQCHSVDSAKPIYSEGLCRACQNAAECGETVCQSDGSCYGSDCLSGYEVINGVCTAVVPPEPVEPEEPPVPPTPIVPICEGSTPHYFEKLNSCFSCLEDSHCGAEEMCSFAGACIQKVFTATTEPPVAPVSCEPGYFLDTATQTCVQPSKQKSSTGYIVGIVILALLLAGMIALAVVYYIWQDKHKKPVNQDGGLKAYSDKLAKIVDEGHKGRQLIKERRQQKDEAKSVQSSQSSQNPQPVKNRSMLVDEGSEKGSVKPQIKQIRKREGMLDDDGVKGI